MSFASGSIASSFDAGRAPIYLVKKNIDQLPNLPSILSLGSSPISNMKDATHWALKIRGICYHMIADGDGEPCKLGPEKIPEYQLLHWSSGNKEGFAGETTWHHYKILNAAKKLVSSMGSYGLVNNNCQDFANRLFLQICATTPHLDLFSQPVIFGAYSAVVERGMDVLNIGVVAARAAGGVTNKVVELGTSSVDGAAGVAHKVVRGNVVGATVDTVAVGASAVRGVVGVGAGVVGGSLRVAEAGVNVVEAILPTPRVVGPVLGFAASVFGW